MDNMELLVECLESCAENCGSLLRMAVEDMKVVAASDYVCSVCAHNIDCLCCEDYVLCKDREYEFGTCPKLVASPCNGCHYERGTNFLWRGYLTKEAKN